MIAACVHSRLRSVLGDQYNVIFKSAAVSRTNRQRKQYRTGAAPSTDTRLRPPTLYRIYTLNIDYHLASLRNSI